MNELGRTKRALEYAIAELVRMHKTSGERVQNDVDKILNPPPEMETVEVIKWYVASQPDNSKYFDGIDFDLAKRCCTWGEEPVKLTGTYQRTKKQPVGRSVSAEVRINECGCPVDARGFVALPFLETGACGKTGTLIFTYSE